MICIMYMYTTKVFRVVVLYTVYLGQRATYVPPVKHKAILSLCAIWRSALSQVRNWRKPALPFIYTINGNVKGISSRIAALEFK